MGFGASQKSRNALFGEVPKRRRQLGGTKKLGFSKKHLFGRVPKRRRQLGGTKKLVTGMETGKYAYGDPKNRPKPPILHQNWVKDPKYQKSRKKLVFCSPALAGQVVCIGFALVCTGLHWFALVS